MTQSLRPLIRQLIRESERAAAEKRLGLVLSMIEDKLDAVRDIDNAIDRVEDAASPAGYRRLNALHAENQEVLQALDALFAERDSLLDQLRGPGWRRPRRGA